MLICILEPFLSYMFLEPLVLFHQVFLSVFDSLLDFLENLLLGIFALGICLDYLLNVFFLERADKAHDTILLTNCMHRTHYTNKITFIEIIN